MDPSFGEEEHALIQREYQHLFIKRDKLEEKKKKLEFKAERYMREKKNIASLYKIIKEKELHVEDLQKELVETNRKNRLLEEFIEKSLLNQETCTNDTTKVLENEIAVDIRK